MQAHGEGRGEAWRGERGGVERGEAREVGREVKERHAWGEGQSRREGGGGRAAASQPAVGLL